MNEMSIQHAYCIACVRACTLACTTSLQLGLIFLLVAVFAIFFFLLFILSKPIHQRLGVSTYRQGHTKLKNRKMRYTRNK